MVTFDFNEYFLKACVIPFVCFIFGCIIVVFSIVKAINLYKKFSSYSLIKRCWLFIPVMSFAFGVVFLAILGQTLKYGIFMFVEDSSDAVLTVGQVDSIEFLEFSPQYAVNKGEGIPAEVEMDGNVYYVMTGNLLSRYETLEFTYLPKSKIITSYQPISFLEYDSRKSVENNTDNPSKIDPIFAIGFVGVMLLFVLIKKTQYWDQKIEQKIRMDEEHWEKNEIRFHSSYIKSTMVFLVILVLTGGALSFAFSNWIILIGAGTVGALGLVFRLNDYRIWKMDYTEHGIVIFSSLGRQEIIPISNVISVKESIEDPFIARGLVYKVVTIKYRTLLKKHSIVQTVKLDYRNQIGIRRFLAFYQSLNASHDESN